MSKKTTLNILSASLLALGLASGASQADTIFGIYAGAGSWSADLEGSIGKPSASLSDLGADDENNRYFYIAIEHRYRSFPTLNCSTIKSAAAKAATPLSASVTPLLVAMYAAPSTSAAPTPPFITSCWIIG